MSTNFDLLRKYAKLNLRPDLHQGLEEVAWFIEDMIEANYSKHEIVELLGMMAIIFAHTASPDKTHGQATMAWLQNEIYNYVEHGFKTPLEVVDDNMSRKPRNNYIIQE